MSGASPAEAMSFRRETVDDNGRDHVEEKRGKSVATANAEEGNGVAPKGSNGINLAAKRTDSAKDNGSRLPVSQKSLTSPIHQSEEEKMKQSEIQSEFRLSIPSLLEKASPSKNLQNSKIFRVHHKDRKQDHFYKPSIISIGPYHHGGEHLKTMEESKVHFLKSLLKRTAKSVKDQCPEETAKSVEDEYVRKIKSLMEEAPGYYLDLPKKWKDVNVFSEMMLLDGCFIVELIHQLRENKLDATVSKGGRLTSILHDLALVENQLPFFVLWELLGISVAKDGEKYECILVLLSTFKRKMTGLSVETFKRMNDGAVKNVKHLVDLLHSLWSPLDHDDDEEQKGISSSTKDMNCGKLTNVKHPVVDLLHSVWSTSNHKGKKEVDEEQKWISSIREGEDVKWTHINSASELIEAGIRFKKVEEGSLFAIEFKNGIFKIPSMIIDDRTESLYHNIIAYEQHSMLIEESGRGNGNKYSKRAKLTFYCRLMDCLINSENDVQILRKRKIIVNCLGDHGAVAQMFNRLGVHVGHISDGFSYAPLFNEVNEYYKNWWNKLRTSLWREHLKTPWAFIPISAAVVLFVLSVLQTQYAIFPRASKGG